MPVQSIQANLRYLKRLELYEKEKPFQVFFDIPENEVDQRLHNLEFEDKLCQIRDIRPHLEDYTLDQHGFAVKQHKMNIDPQMFTNRPIVESQYLPEIERLIREEDPTITKVFFFDWRLRSGDQNMAAAEGRIDLNELNAWIRPNQTVHVDQSPAAVLHRIELQLAAEAQTLLGGRVRIINAWRPIVDAVEDWPLAMCDASSLPDSDLIMCDQVRRKYTGETMYAHSGPTHEWYYLSHQEADEVLLMKMFDSSTQTRAKRCPHASFKHPRCDIRAPSRRSVEVRALVFNC